jgi:hypothetical protein
MSRLQLIPAGYLVFLLNIAVFSQTVHEIQNITLSGLEDKTSLKVGFDSIAPEKFLIYTIVEEGSPVLIAEFVDANWVGDMFAKIQRPVTKIRMVRDTIEGKQSARLLFYLEKNVPYRYRWEGCMFNLEFLPPTATTPTVYAAKGAADSSHATSRAAAATAGSAQAKRLLWTKANNKWTYISAGVLAGGALLGVLLSTEKKEPGQSTAIPDINDVVKLPQ